MYSILLPFLFFAFLSSSISQLDFEIAVSALLVFVYIYKLFICSNCRQRWFYRWLYFAFCFFLIVLVDNVLARLLILQIIFLSFLLCLLLLFLTIWNLTGFIQCRCWHCFLWSYFSSYRTILFLISSLSYFLTACLCLCPSPWSFFVL